MIVFLKAVDRHDNQTMSLFMMPTVVEGHVKANGTFVAPYVAKRARAPRQHPATVAATQHELIEKEYHHPVATEGDDVEAELKPAADDLGLTPEMIGAYDEYADFLDSFGIYGYSAGTTEERRKLTRLQNKYMALAMAGTAGSEDPVARRRIAALSDRRLKGIPAAVASLPPGLPLDGPAPEPENWSRPNKRDVPEYLLPQVEAIIEKANRRAKKLGVDGFRLTKGEPFDRDVSVDKSGLGLQEPRWVRFVPCTIEGPVIKAPGGWGLQGRVDFEDGSVIVNSRPGAELPKRFRSIRPICDHCKSDRQRNAVFVFGRGDEYMQVGRSCLKDYMGRSPEDALWAASEFSVFDDIDRELDEDRAGGNKASQLIGLDEVMTAAAYAVRVNGFVSRKLSEERGGTLLPTSGEVSNYLFDRREVRANYLKDVTQADKDKAAAVIAWVQSEWGSKDDTSDYEYNAVELTARRAVHVRRIGLLTSLVAAYDRAHEEKVAREKRVNAWVGLVGERRDFEATFAGLNQFDTQFGVMFVARFDTPEGLLVYKGGTIWWPVPIEAGTTVKFKATIKEHADYKGTKQTLVSRCIMRLEDKPAKPAKSSKKQAVAA